MEHLTWETAPTLLGLSAAFAAAGLVIFGLAFWLMAKLCPFSIRKEIEEDQNVALAIVMASVIVGIAIIVSTAIS
jgi:putative membrane protein